ncbi:Eukaryotic translation initiation factor 4B [Tupaia chinensis]|uniref:Eukaryotic translation initiation factor 4B n=1 Tax=Tupaia chinensis TaxID=246437 RepID=L9LC60_TUPCH|nr:Eukaryotic translation initiation factor 4B [Tupaia chinensis]
MSVQCVYNINAVCLPHEPSNPEKSKGFGYAEFEDLDSLLSVLSLNEESLGNRRIPADIADQAQDKEWDDHSFVQDRNQDSDKTDTDWWTHPATDSFDDYSPRRDGDSFGDKYPDCYDSGRYQDGYRDRYPDGPCQDMDDYRGQNCCDDQGSRDYDRGYDSKIGSGEKHLFSRLTSIFGETKPVDTAARERKVEERLQKEQEKLQQQLDEPKLERRPQERQPSCRSEETQDRERALTEQQSPTSSGGKVASAQPSEEGQTRRIENKVDGMSVPKGQTGNSSCCPGDGGNKDHWKESDRKDGKKDQDSRSAPESKKPEENPVSKFSSASKYAALFIDGEHENEDYTT